MTENARDIFDYSYVDAIARIALYDDMKSAPRITKIDPAPTNDYIEHLTTTIYEQSKLAGGKIPYSVIREVSENFIHAQFREIVVSILDDGNTIRFADQGPGIAEKEKAQEPGFSSAIEPMKNYIRGVGSGFPIVRDYLGDRDGSIVIEDNLNTGAVVTISLMPEHQRIQPQVTTPLATPTAPIASSAPEVPTALLPRIPLTYREQDFLKILLHEGELGVSDMSKIAETAVSTTHNTFKKLEEDGLVERTPGRKRQLTAIGQQVAATL